MKVSARVPLGALLLLVFPHTASADLVFSFAPTFRAEHGGTALYNGNPDDPDVQPADLVLHATNFSSPSNVWTFEQLAPRAADQSDVPLERGAFIVARIDPDTLALEGGAPVRGENYDFVHAPWTRGTTTSVSAVLALSPLGSASTPSGWYKVVFAELPEVTFFYDPDTGEETAVPFTDEHIGYVLAGDPTVSVNVLSMSQPIFFEYINDAPAETCCSSVLFLPGFEGSVLRLGGNTLWPPTLFDVDADLEKLTLLETGEPLVPGIVVDGITNDFYSVPVYRGFTDFMDGLVKDGTIESWMPFAYDWRFSPEYIIEHGVETASGTVDIVAALEALAADSQTGKVILVAHSNGGLVGKALIKQLEEEGKDDLVEAFVMVGSPQLGTPQAVGGLLHGEGSDIAWKFITFVDKAHARSLGRTLASAHRLLPSRAYFEEVTDPPVVFDPLTPLTAPWRAEWGFALNTYQELYDFLAGLGVPRDRPDAENTASPEVLRQDLLDGADTFHREVDEYDVPSHIRVVQVVGWGVDTIKRIEYKERHGELSYEAITTVEGDGTVVYPSAGAVGNQTLYFHIFDHNDSTGEKVAHANMISAGPVLDVVGKVIAGEEIDGLVFISDSKPSLSDVGRKLLVSSHSPVLLGVHDESGNFTGIDPTQDLGSGVYFTTENIPGSGFITWGGSQYAFLPQGRTYRFVFKGTGTGSTTVEVGFVEGDTATLVNAYTDIPTTPRSILTLVLGPEPKNAPMYVDADGDGDFDIPVPPDDSLPAIGELYALLKEKVTGAGLRKGLQMQFDHFFWKFEFTMYKNAQDLRMLNDDVGGQEKLQRISSEEAEGLRGIIEELEDYIEAGPVGARVLTALRQHIESLSSKVAAIRLALWPKRMVGDADVLRSMLADLEREVAKEKRRGAVSPSNAQELLNLLKGLKEALL